VLCGVELACHHTNEKSHAADEKWRKLVKSEEARRSETRGAEAVVGLLGRGQLAPPNHQLESLGSGLSSLSGVRGKAHGRSRFLCF